MADLNKKMKEYFSGKGLTEKQYEDLLSCTNRCDKVQKSL